MFIYKKVDKQIKKNVSFRENALSLGCTDETFPVKYTSLTNHTLLKWVDVIFVQ